MPRRFSSAEIKSAFGHFSTGVTIITGQSDGMPQGFTCQSFVALSMDPTYIGFCPGRSSTSWPRIRPSGAVCINILASDQEPLCRTFADRRQDRFAHVLWRPGRNGAPAFDGVLARIEANVVNEIEAGDHTIVVAEPTEFWVSPARSPLLYYRGAFGCPHDATGVGA